MKKISKRFNWLLILSICLSVLVSSLFTTALLIYRTRNELHRQNIIQAHSLADNLESFFSRAYSLNYQLSVSPKVIEGLLDAEEDWAQRQEIYINDHRRRDGEIGGDQFLARMAIEYPWVELFFVQDSEGFQTSRSAGMIGERGKRWWFRQIIEDPYYKPFMSKSYYSLTGDKPVASVFHPVYEGEDFLGIIGTDINFTVLQDMVSGYLYSDDISAIVIDSTGTVVAHHDDAYLRELYNLSNRTRHALQKNPDGTIVQDESGHHLTEIVLARIEDELSLAAEHIQKGQGGFIRNTRVGGEVSSIYYQPAYYPGAGIEEGYGIILIYNHSDLIIFTRLLVSGIIVFILLCTGLLYLFFHRLFQSKILDPLSELVDAMEDKDIYGFRQVNIQTGDEFEDLAESYNSLRTNLAETHKDLEARMEELAVSEEGYRSFASIGLAMSGQRKKQEILKLIIREGMSLCCAEGGTLYLFDEQKEVLDFRIIFNDVLKTEGFQNRDKESNFPPVPLYIDGRPNETNVSSQCALSRKLINIPDVYDCEGYDFEGTRAYDRRNDYRSRSMLVVPMKNLEGDLIGILQLINARDSETGEVSAFSEHHENLITTLASQGAVTLTNIQLNKDLEEFLYSFIQSIAAAVDEKSHYTSGHIERVVTLTNMIAEQINGDNSGAFADFSFTEEELEELRIAAWMHDVGKISIPEDVLDKSTKLMFSRDGMELIKLRGALLSALWEVEFLRDLLVSSNISFEDKAEFRALNERIAGLEGVLQRLNLINSANSILSNEEIGSLQEIADISAQARSEQVNLITAEELEYLSIKRGTLSSRERSVIESHVKVTRKILSELRFPHHLARVPEYASQHHEKLDGSGYDRGVPGGELSLQSRIIAVSDIFEALTARDRPYRKPIKMDDALDIIARMCDSGHLDRNIVDLILQKGIVREYCSKTGLGVCEESEGI